ncbi:MAG: hypothetical protein M5U01_27090 [Ardenticatenaceae bacterium]|nr:hypothetical protein [Ardenticatenaceae bacterium]
MGVPLDRPQIALLTYDGAARRYEATYHMGISPQAARAGPRATFALMLYRFDPTWGFRDVIARHRALQPEAHTTTRSLYDYAGAQQGWYFTQHGVEQALAHDAANIYSAQYTVGELPLKLAPKTDPRPTLDEALGVVSDTLSSPVPSDAALARAINGSAVVDPNGDWSLKKLGVFEWAPEWWEAIWAANLDPDLEDGLASWILDWRVTPAFTATTEAGAHLDGVQMDNFMSPPALDLRPEALAVADRSLSYTPHTYRPAVHNGFSYHEYLTSLRDYLDSEWGTDRDISINFWGLGNPNYLASYIDAFGSEGNLRGNGEGENWTPEILDYRRAIAYSRPYLFANQTDALTATEAYTFSQTALLYGVRPRRGPNASPWEPEVEQMISDTVELITRYWAAGWEPLTYARTDGDDVWIERFGDLSPTPGLKATPSPSPTRRGGGGPGEGGEVFFPVHNRTDLTRTATVTIEAVPLGITYPTSVEITDLATEQPVPFSVEAGNIVVSLDLGPRETRVLQVSGGTTPPASECVGDANGIGDVVDVMATASELPCQVYLPLVAAQWRQPWPSPTAGPPYPRLARLTWYEPGNFAHSLSERTDGRITIDDPNHTALVDILAAHQLVVVSGRVLSGSYPGVQTDRGRLAQARDEAGFLLLGRWETSGIELYDLSFTNTQPGSPFPFVPEWFVQEVAGPLPQAVWAGDTVVPIADGEQNAYCFLRENYLNDQVIILDGDRSEAVKLDCDVWDGSSLTIPLTLDSALRSPYDFGLFKSDHAAGTPVRINTSPSWDAWWGYNMTDIGPTYRCTVKTLPVLCSGSFAAATGERIR